MEETTRNLKVVFLGFGLAHYFNDLLCRLQEDGGIEAILATVKGGNPRLGAGVHETRDNVAFRIVELEEETREAPWSYPLLELAHFQKPQYPSFPELPAFLEQERPDIVVVCVDDFALFTYDTTVRDTVSRLGIKTVFHSIPFQLSNYDDEVERCRRNATLALGSIPTWLAACIRILRLDTAYSLFVRERTLMCEINARRRIFSAADVHVCYFEGGIDIYGSYGVLHDRIHVVRNSPDTDKLFAAREQIVAEGQLKRDPFRLIHVGRLVEWKRVDLLIRTVAALRADFPEVNAVIVGKGPQEEDLKELTTELGVSDAVTFTGAIYDPLELGRQFMQAGVYVLAGMGGLSINEAMCFGLPAVCSVCDGTELFLVRDGVTGLRFRNGDLDDLVRKIKTLLENRESTVQMGRAAAQLIREELNIHILAGNYLRLFRQLTETETAR